MKSSFILALVGVAMALPSLEAVPPNSEKAATQDQKATLFHPDRIISSDGLHAYLQANHDSNYTIYINDTGMVIDLASVELTQPNVELLNLTHTKRAPPDPYCWKYKQHWAEQTQNWWDSWNPASSCLANGYGELPATQSISWSYSKSITTNSGLDWKIIKDVLSISAGFSVTETWSHSGTWTCQIPAHSIGQIWISNKIVWGWIWERTCENCGPLGSSCWGATAKGGATAPVSTTGSGVGVQYGCSTGWDKVRC